MIEIPILLILKHASIIGLCFLLPALFYRYILHKNYRWHQKGNVCYRNAYSFACYWCVILSAFIESLINGIITFTL